MRRHAGLDWAAIDTVLIDMDGTLLDQRFDNWFWEEHVPRCYAVLHGVTDIVAARLLAAKFQSMRGTIQWYCLDYWSAELGLDIAAIKREVLHRVRYLPGALQFLGKLKASGKRRVLVTNAHPVTLAIKDVQARLTENVDAWYSTHTFQTPKENAAFWPKLRSREPFEPARTLFIDDSLPVLDAAHAFGVGWLRAIRLPDSGRCAQQTGHYVAVDGVADLM